MPDLSNREPGTANREPISRHSGYTLSELLVVLAVVATVTIGAFMAMPDPRGQDDRLATDQLRAGLRYAQNLAMCRERFVRVAFSVASNTFAVAIATSNPPTAYVSVPHPVRQTDWLVSFGEDYPDVKLAAVNIGGGDGLLFSATNGVPCAGSGALLDSTGVVTFASGRRLNITPGTGYVTVQ
ncbi:MAG: prepilin-type N-terminal cleavage/methylation domain-containing protein [Verrucomicrobiota bacterium]|nr:prepilin-type N-terminal cleavage/methylation domain-containing protein [Verrucomicrobiota bacterium]